MRWLVLLVMAAAFAQERSAFVVLLRDPSGAVVRNATGTLLLPPQHALPALPQLALPPALAPFAASRLQVLSDARGELRVLVEHPPHHAALLVTTGEGLGALLPELHADAAQRVALQPLGELALADGAPFALFARAATADRMTAALPTLAGVSVRLPAGEYEGWFTNADGWQWQRFAVHAGERTKVLPAAATLVTPLRAGLRVFPEGWPEVELSAAASGLLVLRGEARWASLCCIDATTGLVVTQPAQAVAPWPTLPSSAALPVAWQQPAPAATQLLLLRRHLAGSWQLLATSQNPQSLTVPTDSSGEDWLLVLAAGKAPLGQRWPLSAPLALRDPAPALALSCGTADGLPVADVPLTFVPDAGEVASCSVRSDRRGRAWLSAALQVGTLQVSDPRFANQTLRLSTPESPLRIVLQPGAVLTGQVIDEQGRPANAAAVTLRDPRGVLQPQERTTLCDAAGSFSFAGLHAEHDYVLLAVVRKAGRTWSAKVVGARAATPARLQLADEDPRLLR